MTYKNLNRRAFLTTTLLATGTVLASGPSSAQSSSGQGQSPLTSYKPEESDFPYEIVRTEAEWREHLDNDDFAYDILRLAGTETPKTTDLWLEPHEGGYLCRGCDLPLYEARWFQRLDKGWVFFHHAVPNAVLFGLDGPVPEYGQAGMLDEDTVVAEIHCRRCGSHIGHHITVSGMFLHCLNGTALKLV